MAGQDCHGLWKYWPVSGPVFTFPIGKILSLWKKIDAEIFTNLHVLRSQESEKVDFKKVSCVQYCVLYDGCWRRKYTRNYDETVDMRQDQDRDARFFGVLCNKGYNEG